MSGKSIITILLIVFSSLIVKGQVFTNYKAGLIVTNDNDTLYGLIDDRGDIKNTEACVFKKDKENIPEKFLPGDIKAYGFPDEKYYKSVELYHKDQFKHVFLDVLVQGKVNLYYFRGDDYNSYYIQKDDGEIYSLSNEVTEYTNVPVTRGTAFWRTYKLESKRYIVSLYSLFQDSRETQVKLEKLEYKKKPMMGITKHYITETCGADCINYVKRPKKGNFGIYSGFSINKIFFQTPSHLNDYNYSSGYFINYPFGIFYAYPLTRINERVTFQTELNTSKYKLAFNDNIYYNQIELEYRQVGLAFSLRYKLFQHSMIAPSIALGKNTNIIVSSNGLIDNVDEFTLNPLQNGGWFFEIGTDYMVNRRFSMFGNFRIQSFYGMVPLYDQTGVGSVLMGLKF